MGNTVYGLRPASEVRALMRQGVSAPTAGVCEGNVQANLAILPKQYAYDFLLFCYRNPKPCPLLDVTDPGSPRTRLAKDADLRTDLPKYRVYENGNYVAEVTDITQYWSSDLVAFLIGCSYTFESALLAGGVPVRHIEQGTVVPMYTSNIQCAPSGTFSGPTVITMRPIPYELVSKAVQITSRYPGVHGAPVHVGDPAYVGVDLSRPEYGGQISEIRKGETPVFWACGVTPQAVAQKSRVPLMITHAPGHMFITDIRNEHLAAL